MFVGADGPPYCLMRCLLKQNPGQYDWVSLVSGGGHLNMNLLKTYFKVLEKIILEPFGKENLKHDTQKSLTISFNVKTTTKRSRFLIFF